MGYIYKITNDFNSKVYIGKTTYRIEERLKQHYYASNRSYNNRPLYDAFKKYGFEHFKISLIEEVDNEILNEKEMYWIRQYNSYIGFDNSNGYNATLGGDSTQTKDYKLIIEDYLKTKSKAQTAKNCNCCLQTVTCALETYHIKTLNNSQGQKIIRVDENNSCKTYNSIREAAYELAEVLNKNPQTIRKRINNVILHHPEQKAYGYYWKINS